MREPKTKPSAESVKDFLSSIEDDQIRKDSLVITSLMHKATKAKPKMWGTAIVGFGTRKQKYADGSEREWMQISFSPRKNKLTLYVTEFKGCEKLLANLGKFKRSSSCIHITSLSDIDLPTLNKLITESVKKTK